ncbi:MAG: sulfite exporter TauE/SafE family protein [Erysipelotrichaceae bacterium]|nr:sulfite exporter TauE/SafE family protein [Erysipelotrichaceae bacterium]
MVYMILGIALLAGLVQGVTGFGGSIVMMMVFPYLFALLQAAGISTAICTFLNLIMVINYQKYINIKKIIPPAILYIMVCSITITLATTVNQTLMKKVFGVFLIILAIYYLFIDKGERKKLSLIVSIICIVVSAMCDGLFGIGGPLMVLYFLSQTHNTHEYLGTISLFFMINCIYNTCFRIYNGIISIAHLPYIAIGVVSIMIGGLIATRIVDKLNGAFLRKLTYIMIGISGIVNLLF